MAEPIPNTYEDFVISFPGGMNSGTLPRLLSPDHAAFLQNVTLREGFPTDRPKYRKLTLTFADGIETAAKTGLFQGAGFFRAQSGAGSLLSSIAGRIFQFTPGDNTAAVSERTISGDPNSPTQPQAWIWQSELWAIVNDGNSLPVFVDDTTSRRSAGPAVSLGTTSASFVVPAIGSNVTLTLSANYTGPLNATVFIDTGNYIVVAVGSPPSGAAGYEATVKNINDTPGGTLAIGTPVISPGSTNVLGTTAAAFNVPVFLNQSVQIQFTASVAFPGSSPVWIAGRRYTFASVADLALHKYNLKVQDPNTSGSTVTVPSGTPCTYPQNTPIVQPSYTIGNLVATATVPAVNGSVSVFLDALYAGAADQPVTINGKSYRITAVSQGPPTPSTTVIVKNLTIFPSGGTVTSGKSLLTIQELGIGRMGVYGLGRNWMSLIDGQSFTASDLVGQSSGSSAYNFRDAVLKVTKNQALADSKPFRVPNAGETIRGLSFVAALDVSMGQGPLQVLTDSNVIGCNAPFDDAVWATMTNPIITESLKGAGGTSQESTVNSNADIFFRDATGNIRSFLIARLDFHKWGNTPISYEMQRVIEQEDISLLQYGSAVVFDNRLLMTAGAVQSAQGVYHRGLMVINFDEISSLSEKSPSIYDGLWTGLNILQVLKGKFSGVERAFAFCANTVTNEIELWELIKTGEATTDNSTKRVIWAFETADLFRGQRGELVRTPKALEDGEMSVDDVQGRVDFKVYYRPDAYPGWVLWHEWAIDNDMNRPNSAPGYFPRMGFGKPKSDSKNALTNENTRQGYTFQVRVVIQGHCRFTGMRLAAAKQPQAQFAKPICGNTPATTNVQVEAESFYSVYNINAGIP